MEAEKKNISIIPGQIPGSPSFCFHHVYDEFSNHCQQLATPSPKNIIDLQNETKKHIVKLLTKVLPHHEPPDVPCFTPLTSFEPADVYSDCMEQEAAKEKGVFIQALWTLHAKSKLYRLAYKT
ncbi:hypothetical protein TNIN_156041 [Trichonephila inaurata madagascariensis]|uniref:Uncharacterized protein n=1 Tax=Trichonephila inaurata madagascariensis TaxID=2747483 RepID=A0A8X7CAE0_9ARAC|nr:hypothetical protein TNIN_156041 [Trichonephila inaurata madagascariensis]